MPVTFTTTMSGASSDYERYLYGAPVKTDRHKDSSLLDFTLVPLDPAFVKLRRGAYITFDTVTYPKWFTGYVINEPEPEFLGKNSSGQAVWGYRYQATSDEVVLSLKPIGVIPPFLNKTMGEILKSLVARLVPGTFDVTGIQDGPLMAQYTVEPSKKFFDVQQELSESSSYRFWGNDRKLYFKPQSDASLGSFTLDGNNAHFTPTRLTVRPVNSGNGIINDITVLGDTEPQSYVHEYFVGTGLDGSFPLLTGVYGADTSVLLDEPFSGSAVDSAKWKVFDTPSNFLQIANGYLNSLGGTGTGAYDVRIESVSPIPLDGRLRITHGDWDILAGVGIICGLWTQAPNTSYTGCVYGLKVNGTTVNPVVGGVLDTSQSLTVDVTKRYVIRTIVEFEKTDRLQQQYNYLTGAGAVSSYGGSVAPDEVVWETLISEVDPSDGSVTNQVRFLSTGSLTTAAYATYIPLASNTLQAAFTGVTVSIPVAATLEYAEQLQIKDGGFDEWDSPTEPTHWPLNVNCFLETTHFDSVASAKLSPDGTGVSYAAQAVDSILKAETSYYGIVRLRKTIGMVAGEVRISFSGTGITHPGIAVNVSTISDSSYGIFTGLITTPIAVIPTDATFKVEVYGGTTGEGVYVDNITVISGFERKLIGPNEVDGLDGLRPVATIVSSNVGADTRSTYLGVPQYNPGQSSLTFFKDSVTQDSEIPPEHQLIRLSYRNAGPAIGRAISRSSVEAEGQKWLDDGVRSSVRTDVLPRPRNSAECELAASALVAENSVNHYDGTYEQYSMYFTAEPKAGGLITFANVSSMADIQVEEINQVTTSFESKRPNEIFKHTISFGKPDTARHILGTINGRKQVFQRGSENSLTSAVDINAVGTLFAGDVTKPFLVGWNDSFVFMDTGEVLGSDDLFFEVRYTDEGWGVEDGKNLITRTTNRAFAVPRTRRGKVFFVRKARKGNHILYSEDQTQGSVYSGLTRTKSIGLGPDGQYSQITSVAFSGAGTLTGTLSGLTGSTFAGTISIKGPANKSFTLNLGGSTKTFTTTGYWQRVTVSRTGSAPTSMSLQFSGTGSFNVETTRWSVEQGTLAETSYAKTTTIKYGPVSRYSSAINIAFPSTVVSGATIDLDSLIIIPTY